MPNTMRVRVLSISVEMLAEVAEHGVVAVVPVEPVPGLEVLYVRISPDIRPHTIELLVTAPSFDPVDVVSIPDLWKAPKWNPAFRRVGGPGGAL